MRKSRLILAALACCLAAPAAAKKEKAAWRAEPEPKRPGGVETCAVRWPSHGLAVMVSRWGDGAMTHLISLAEANPKSTLELILDDGKRFMARAIDVRYWARPDVVEALLAGKSMKAEFLDRDGKPVRVDVDLASLKAAYEACQVSLGAAPTTASAKER